MGLIKKIDFLFQEVHFTFNKNGDTGFKTLLGGILSLLTVLLSMIISIYFIIRLLLKKDATVIFSTKQDSNINLLYSYKLPFLFRLSDEYSNPLDYIKIYEVKVNYWYSISNSINNITIQHFTNLTYKKCNINEHLNDFKEYFINKKDLESFFCLDPRDENKTLFGVYGDKDSFSYIHFEFFICNNKTMNNKCLSKENIKKILNDAYLDLRYINYNVNSNKKNVKSISIKSERIPISYSSYKRIWINFKTIEFISDNGLIFSKISKEIFHQFSNLRIDTDLRDMDNGIRPGNFLSLTFSLNGEVSIFNKEYSKIQNVLATIGGFIKAITFFFHLLNYYNAKNSYYKKIIKDFLITNQIKKKEQNILMNKTYNIISNLGNNSNYRLNFKDSIQTNNFLYNLENNFKYKDNFKNKFKNTFNQFRISSKKINTNKMKWYIEIINNKLNIINILNTLEGYNKLKESFQKKENLNKSNSITDDIVHKNNYLMNKI